MSKIELMKGDCLEKMKDIPDGSVDLVLTDPPYELGFMAKHWDKSGIAYNVELWKECLRVLRPGGHLLSFGGTRTYHRMACAIEDAGFEVRDMIEWVYGSGFPKSLNIGKAVDKLQGNERERILVSSKAGNSVRRGEGKQGSTYGDAHGGFTDIGKGTSEWEGWGTALKPSHEPICMARKPLSEKTVAENCLKWGTGGINIDESRVEISKDDDNWRENATLRNDTKNTECYGKYNEIKTQNLKEQGRFPANLIHDNSEEVRECFPESKSAGVYRDKERTISMVHQGATVLYSGPLRDIRTAGKYGGDSGNASRFFKSIIYIAKASKSERNRGCEGLEKKEIKHGLHSTSYIREKEYETHTIGKNNHPTVKPIALMEYLIKMASREGATILDPFMGSGTTGVSCKNLKRNFIGIELDPEYFKIAEKRINEIIFNAIQFKFIGNEKAEVKEK